MLERLDSLVRKSLVVVEPRRPHAIRHVRDHPAVRRGSSCRSPADSHGMRDRHAAYFAASASHRYQNWNGPGWRAAVDWVEIELDNLRTAFRWSMQRGDLDVATDVAAHAALMGFSVQLFETLGWAEELLPAATAAADVRRLPRLYTGAGYACFAGRAEAAAANAHRATELETDPRLRRVRARVRDLHRGARPGLLRPSRSLRRAHRRGGGAAEIGDACLRHRGVPRWTAVRRSGRRGARIDRLRGRCSPRARQPLLDLVHPVDRRVGTVQGRQEAGTAGVGRRRRGRA